MHLLVVFHFCSTALGDQLELHPVIVLLSLIFWALLWGIAGAHAHGYSIPHVPYTCALTTNEQKGP